MYLPFIERREPVASGFQNHRQGAELRHSVALIFSTPLI